MTELRRRAGHVVASVVVAAVMVGGILAAVLVSIRPVTPGLELYGSYGPAAGYPLPPGGDAARYRLVGADDVFRFEFPIVNPADESRLVVSATSGSDVVDVGWRTFVDPAGGTDDDPTAPVPAPPDRPSAVRAFPAVIPAHGGLVVRLTVHKPAHCPPMAPGSAGGPSLTADFGWYDGTTLREDSLGIDDVEMIIATCGG